MGLYIQHVQVHRPPEARFSSEQMSLDERLLNIPLALSLAALRSGEAPDDQMRAKVKNLSRAALVPFDGDDDLLAFQQRTGMKAFLSGDGVADSAELAEKPVAALCQAVRADAERPGCGMLVYSHMAPETRTSKYPAMALVHAHFPAKAVPLGVSQAGGNAWVAGLEVALAFAADLPPELPGVALVASDLLRPPVARRQGMHTYLSDAASAVWLTPSSAGALWRIDGAQVTRDATDFSATGGATEAVWMGRVLAALGPHADACAVGLTGLNPVLRQSLVQALQLQGWHAFDAGSEHDLCNSNLPAALLRVDAHPLWSRLARLRLINLCVGNSLGVLDLSRATAAGERS